MGEDQRQEPAAAGSAKPMFTVSQWRDLLLKALAIPQRDLILPDHLVPMSRQHRSLRAAFVTEKHSAVLIVCFPVEFVSESTPVELCFPVTLRGSNLRVHGGQVSLPGGRCDEGETFPETAARETWEEIGLLATEYDILGTMLPVFSFPTNSWVHPVVALAKKPLRPYIASPTEVQSIHYLFLSQLIFHSGDSHFAHRFRNSSGGSWDSPAYFTSPSPKKVAPVIIPPRESRMETSSTSPSTQVQATVHPLQSVSREPVVWGMTALVVGELIVRLAAVCGVSLQSNGIWVSHQVHEKAPAANAQQLSKL
jgi:8-oxo-dGTP pyrophosphatase MutT (NUDIX family)